MTKKITLIICYALIGLIALALVICALVPVSYLPANTKSPDKLTVTYIEDTNQQAFYNTSSEEFKNNENIKADYDNIVSTFRNSFKQSVLSALFAGELITTMIPTGIGENSITKPEKGFEIRFEYFEEQNIYVNDKIYTDPNDSTRTVKTKTMYCYITEDIGFGSIYIYYEDDSQENKDVEYYRVQTIASTKTLSDLCYEILNIEKTEE